MNNSDKYCCFDAGVEIQIGDVEYNIEYGLIRQIPVIYRKFIEAEEYGRGN